MAECSVRKRAGQKENKSNKTKLRREKIIERKAGFLVLALILILVTDLFRVRADVDENGREASPLSDFAISMIDTILGVNADEEGTAASVVNDEISIVFNVSGTDVSSIDMMGFSFTGVVPETINSVNKICRNVGLVLLVVMFCITLMQDYINGNQYDEIFVRRLVIFGISIACLYYAQVICMELSNLGTEVIGSIGSEISEVSFENTLRDTIYEETTYEPSDRTWSVESIGKYLNAFIASLKYIVVFSLPWLMTWIATIMIRAVCISRSLELIVMVALCPLAFVGMHGHGIESMIRFIRGFFSLCIQGAVIYLAVMICSQITGTIVGDLVLDGADIGTTLSSLLNLGLLYVVEAGFVSRSRQIAQALVGY